jgi:hypothetical protein
MRILKNGGNIGVIEAIIILVRTMRILKKGCIEGIGLYWSNRGNNHFSVYFRVLSGWVLGVYTLISVYS